MYDLSGEFTCPQELARNTIKGGVITTDMMLEGYGHKL